MQLTKRCPKCEETKDVGEFPGSTSSYCRPCWNQYARDYRAKNRERVRNYQREYKRANPSTPEQNRARSLWSNFRLTVDRWEAIFNQQGRACAVCRRDTPNGNGWHVDHDHACCSQVGRSCGACIRSILCSSCNVMLGYAQDDPALLRAAADYLERVKE